MLLVTPGSKRVLYTDTMKKQVQWNREQGGKRRVPRRHVVLAITVIMLAAAIIAGGMVWNASKRTEPDAKPDQQRTNTNKPDPIPPRSVEGRYLFNGTAVLARAVERDAGSDLSQPFSQMQTFNPDQYDAMTLDWECPSTEDVIPYATQVSNLLFNCHVKWLPEVSKHFSIVSLTNNHSGDLGAEAFLTTQKNLNAAGIQTYGNNDSSVEKDVCEVIALPVRVQNPDETETEGKLPIAFCSWHYFFRSPEPGEMEIMEKFVNVMPVFGFMHAGAEYYATAGADQEAIARRMIDLGAEFSIGNSPHWVQNGEVYKGKPIFYSTGNFIFDQIDYETMRGLSVDVSIDVPYDENVAQWLELGERCVALHDDCLDYAKQQGLKKVAIDLSYDVVGSSGGARRITTRADETLQRAIEERVGWSDMQQKLGQTASN